jgi:beta-glucosidase/6-phospho-beta-glucosidase/beta-galactosidase
MRSKSRYSTASFKEVLNAAHIAARTACGLMLLPQLLYQLGVKTVRDGLRWHQIEKQPGYYDWSSFLPMLRASQRVGTQVVWDLFHYGWPDGLDIWAPEFVGRFARFAAAVARVVREESDAVQIFTPINEISFTAWAGGQFAIFNPFGEGRGDELKTQLVRASIAGIEACWDIDERTRIAHIEPAIHVLPNSDDARTAKLATEYNEAQFQAWDMVSGRLNPSLGGKEEYLDIIGVNYYCHNQWRVGQGPIEVTDKIARRFSDMIAENHHRYGRPIFIAETGIEADARAGWLRYVCAEVKAAIKMNVPVTGICLYPVMNHPGWDDDRHCPNGILDYDRTTFERSVDQELLRELKFQQSAFAQLFKTAKGDPVDMRVSTGS